MKKRREKQLSVLNVHVMIYFLKGVSHLPIKHEASQVIVVLMLCHRLRRWPNIKTTLTEASCLLGTPVCHNIDTALGTAVVITFYMLTTATETLSRNQHAILNLCNAISRYMIYDAKNAS